MVDYLQTFATTMKNSLLGFISLGLVDFTGNILVKEQVDDRVNVELESAFQLEVVKQAMKSLSVSDLNIGNKLRDITIETQKFTYYIGLSEDQKAVVVIMLDASKANLGITRSIIARERKTTGSNLDKDLQR